ncbi:MAG: ParB/RepB/Spo0J family partition protein [Candidatus Cloacimonadota bacterium]|nr:ParB/RepB/Spo0J family partition protein [Candidatus Cloacimonadota bacterium]
MSKLGKGLEALIKVNEEETKQVNLIDVKKVKFNPYQPRKTGNKQKLQELADSISENGIIQPVIVRRISNDRYELITGQRRLTAAQLAGFEKVPVIIRSAKDAEMLELSIIENIQREDLNPIDEALAYERLVSEFKLTHNRIAEIVGKSRVAVTNMLRLLKLPSKVLDMIKTDVLSTGHARAILQVEPKLQLEFANYIIKNKLPVHSAEGKAKSFGRMKKKLRKIKKDVNILAVENELSKIFGAKVKLTGCKKGKLEIYFYSEEELNKIINIISKAQ